MPTCQDVADFFLAQCEEEAGDLMSNLKLQKLVYYAQGFHLAITGVALFDDDIEAWTHGPVVADLYHAYKQFGSGALPPLAAIPDVFSSDQLDLLNEINEIYGQFSGWKLRNMTHEESPWLNASRNGYNIIDHDALRSYFKTQLNG